MTWNILWVIMGGKNNDFFQITCDQCNVKLGHLGGNFNHMVYLCCRLVCWLQWGPPACDAPAVINTEEISPLWLSALRRPEQLQKRSRQPLTGLSSVTRQIKPINGRTGLLVLAKCTPSYPFQFIPKASVWGCVKWYCVSHLIWALWAQSGPL